MTRAVAPRPRMALPDVRAAIGRARARWAGLGLRQQALVLAATTVVTLGGLDAAWLAPQDAAHRAQRAKVEALEKSAAERAEASGRAQAEQQRLRDQEQALRDRMAAAEAALASARSGLVGPATLRERLRVLSQDSAVRLVALTTMPPEAVSLSSATRDRPAAPAAAASGAAGSSAPGPNEPVLYRWGVQVTVEGRFEDLQAYLERLERSELGLRWSLLTLDNRTWPQVRMELRLFMLGDQPVWRGS